MLDSICSSYFRQQRLPLLAAARLPTTCTHHPLRTMSSKTKKSKNDPKPVPKRQTMADSEDDEDGTIGDEDLMACDVVPNKANDDDDDEEEEEEEEEAEGGEQGNDSDDGENNEEDDDGSEAVPGEDAEQHVDSNDEDGCDEDKQEKPPTQEDANNKSPGSQKKALPKEGKESASSSSSPHRPSLPPKKKTIRAPKKHGEILSYAAAHGLIASLQLSPSEFHDYVCARAFDVISGGMYRKFLVQSRADKEVSVARMMLIFSRVHAPDAIPLPSFLVGCRNGHSAFSPPSTRCRIRSKPSRAS